MFKRTIALLALAVFSGVNPASAQEMKDKPIVLHWEGQVYAVSIESNDSNVLALATKAIGAHGAYNVKSGSSRSIRFSKTSDTSITVTCSVGTSSQSQNVTGSDANDTIMRACDAAIVMTGKAAKHLPLYTGKLAFVSDRTGKKEIYSSDLFLTSVQPLTNLNSISITPHWTYDGSEVLFTTYYNNNFTDIYAVSVNTKKLRDVVVGVKGTSTGAVSAPGGQIAFSSSSSGNTDIYVAASTGKGARAVVRSGDVDSDPSWSADGSRLAYVSGVAGAPGIFVSSASGGGATRIRTDSNYTTEPTWNPVEPNKLAFTYTQKGGFQIGVVDINSGEIKQVTKSGGYTHPTWCADGRHIVATKSSGGSAILVLIDSESGKETTISGSQMRNCSEADYKLR